MSAEMPPESHPYSPMGQIEHFGFALHSETARSGWRRRVIVTVGVLWVVVVVGTLILSVMSAVLG